VTAVQGDQGPILKMFLPKKIAKKLALLAHNKAKL
jgi:hypothetical protein